MNEHHASSSLSGTGRQRLIALQLQGVFRRFLFYILCVGPIPNHIAFIMDGNRRYTKKKNLDEGAGHKAGFLSLMSMLSYCYELGVKYVTVYAFSIDNFKRNPNEVQMLMDLILETMERLLSEESIVNEYGIRIYIIGDLRLLNEPVRIAAENIMRATANNTKCTLLVCVAYTSRDEIVRAVEESCADKRKESAPFNSVATSNGVVKEFHSSSGCDTDVKNGTFQQSGQGSCICRITNGTSAVEVREKMQGEPSIIKVVDIEKHMNMSVAPDPDLLIRTSGETRLSNFLLWQTSNCLLYSPYALWPEIGLRHLAWGVINYQRNHAYLVKKNKQS